MMLNTEELDELADAYAFLGNSLLKPMNGTADIGLDPSFWREFPVMDDEGSRTATQRCARWAEEHSGDAREDTVRQVSTEYAKLFVGPPEPAAAPWETMHVGSEPETGFGKPTFLMKELLRKAGKQLAVPNRQYEDHLGIELLYVSVRCAQIAQGDDDAREALADFLVDHPLAWIDSLIDDVEHAAPNGYYANLLFVTKALLRATERRLRDESSS